MTAKRERIAYHSAAVHEETNRLVAWTTITKEKSLGWNAFQQITIVDPDHRGHRLGALVKVENLRFFREHEPTVTAIDTFNAHSNSYMIQINEQMGFRPLYAWQNWKLELLKMLTFKQVSHTDQALIEQWVAVANAVAQTRHAGFCPAHAAHGLSVAKAWASGFSRRALSRPRRRRARGPPRVGVPRARQSDERLRSPSRWCRRCGGAASAGSSTTSCWSG